MALGLSSCEASFFRAEVASSAERAPPNLIRHGEARYMALEFDRTGLDAYITDPTLESEVGVTVKFPRGRKFRILRAGGANKRFARAFQAAIRPHRRDMERGTMDDDESHEIMLRLYPKYVVIGWEGIKDAEGKDIPYSPQAAEAYFRTFPNVFDDIVRLATEMSLFSEKQIQEAKKTLGEA